MTSVNGKGAFIALQLLSSRILEHRGPIQFTSPCLCPRTSSLWRHHWRCHTPLERRHGRCLSHFLIGHWTRIAGYTTESVTLGHSMRRQIYGYRKALPPEIIFLGDRGVWAACPGLLHESGTTGTGVEGPTTCWSRVQRPNHYTTIRHFKPTSTVQ